MLLPGYTMTSGIVDLASHHIVSGIVRMFYAIVYSFLLGYGLSMGMGLWETFDPAAKQQDTTCKSDELSKFWNILFVPVFGVAMCIWLKARPRRWFIMCLFGALGYLSSLSLSTWTLAPPQVVQFVPGNIYIYYIWFCAKEIEHDFLYPICKF